MDAVTKKIVWKSAFLFLMLTVSICCNRDSSVLLLEEEKAVLFSATASSELYIDNALHSVI